MITLKKYPLKSKTIQSFELHESHIVFEVRVENDVSDPELYILEDTTTELVETHILICQELFEINYKLKQLKYIGNYLVNRIHKFWIFEVLSGDIKSIVTDEIKIEKYKNSQIEEEKPTIAKWARIPKPDLDKVYTIEELKDMHPERQLKYILVNKYEVKGRIRNKLSIDKKIEYILRKQNGEDLEPESLLNEPPILLPRENVETIIKRNLDDISKDYRSDEPSINSEIPQKEELSEIAIDIVENKIKSSMIPVDKPYIVQGRIIFRVKQDPQV